LRVGRRRTAEPSTVFPRRPESRRRPMLFRRRAVGYRTNYLAWPRWDLPKRISTTSLKSVERVRHRFLSFQQSGHCESEHQPFLALRAQRSPRTTPQPALF
jgi:hypothetical protein